jgi:hypothetical protein
MPLCKGHYGRSIAVVAEIQMLQPNRLPLLNISTTVERVFVSRHNANRMLQAVFLFTSYLVI